MKWGRLDPQNLKVIQKTKVRLEQLEAKEALDLREILDTQNLLDHKVLKEIQETQELLM